MGGVNLRMFAGDAGNGRVLERSEAPLEYVGPDTEGIIIHHGQHLACSCSDTTYLLGAVVGLINCQDPDLVLIPSDLGHVILDSRHISGNRDDDDLFRLVTKPRVQTSCKVRVRVDSGQDYADILGRECRGVPGYDCPDTGAVASSTPALR